MNLLRGLLRRAFPALERFGRNVHTLAVGHGQWRSMREGVPVDRGGAPLPWYTYPAIEYLSAFDWSAARIFEFGAGHSSMFWSSRALEVVSVDGDPEWVRLLRERSRPNQQLQLRQERAGYVAAIGEQTGDFDVIVVDGRWRHECARAAAGKLRPGGMIVIDNSDRYPEAARGLRTLGFLQVDFSGFGPVNGYAWTTSIFVRADCRLQADFAGPRPIGGQGRTIVPGQEE